MLLHRERTSAIVPEEDEGEPGGVEGVPAVEPLAEGPAAEGPAVGEPIDTIRNPPATGAGGEGVVEGATITKIIINKGETT